MGLEVPAEQQSRGVVRTGAVPGDESSRSAPNTRRLPGPARPRCQYRLVSTMTATDRANAVVGPVTGTPGQRTGRGSPGCSANAGRRRPISAGGAHATSGTEEWMGALRIDRLVPRLYVRTPRMPSAFPRRESAPVSLPETQTAVAANARVSGRSGYCFYPGMSRERLRPLHTSRCRCDTSSSCNGRDPQKQISMR